MTDAINPFGFPSSVEKDGRVYKQFWADHEKPRALYRGEDGRTFLAQLGFSSADMDRAETLAAASRMHSPGADRCARIEAILRREGLILAEFVTKDPDKTTPAWEDRARTLRKYLSEHKPSLSEAFGIVSQIGALIAYLAPHGGHGDLHDENVLIQEGGRIWILDYVKCVDSTPDGSHGNEGSPEEQRRRKDLRALALFLIQLCTREKVWEPDKYPEDDWEKEVEKKSEGFRHSISLDRRAIGDALAKLTPKSTPTTERTQAKIRFFLQALEKAPHITPSLVPASLGCLLTQISLLVLLSTCGFSWTFALKSAPKALTTTAGVPLTLTAAQPTLIPATTPVPPTSPVPIPTATTPVANPAVAPGGVTPSISTGVTPGTPASTQVTVTQIAPISTTPPAPPPSASSTATAQVRLVDTTTPTPPVQLPDNCDYREDNARALAETESFGFRAPTNHSPFVPTQGFQVQIRGFRYYAIRFIRLTENPGARIENWHVIWGCPLYEGRPRCLKPVDLSDTNMNSDGVLTVPWSFAGDAPSYAFLLELEKENGDRYCTMVYNVTLR